MSSSRLLTSHRPEYKGLHWCRRQKYLRSYLSELTLNGGPPREQLHLAATATSNTGVTNNGVKCTSVLPKRTLSIYEVLIFMLFKNK